MRANSEIPFDEQAYIMPMSEAALTTSVRSRLPVRRLVATTGTVATLILNSACAGVPLDENAKRGAMTGNNDTKASEHGARIKTDQKSINASGREFCPQPQKLNDGTGRIRVQVSTSCPVQVISIGKGWITFEWGSAGYKLDGGAEVDSVVSDGADAWIVDLK